MAISNLPFCLLLCILLSLHRPVLCDNDEEDSLLTVVNSYRTSQNLTTLTKNKNAECLADEIAEQFKNQPCTNTTGSNTVPGTEPQFPNFPELLSKCHLNVSATRDGAIMPACVHRLDQSVVLSNFTKSQYSMNLNDSKFTGIGIGSDHDWVVVVLTTNTPEGSYSPATKDSSNGDVFGVRIVIHSMLLVISTVLFLL
ncbi:PREDICTED: uncharacterized GPI-anchored protein At3g06035 isoform X2 [Tarenaya hassleriana]|uniref:uncharacterized GPI-anchored protein At3g06035 isoform X1 n=1 Tax=Tarenaya hassleriana TaxID=28532 RepID=UPI00053C2533|nr:PREDICTED: uncharacterized GPI-anchored protein At3g06035 isoform X1 [Tarenaya hassleriana]XP_010524806.1 PREDICTED: uncharacterized GPI-anchored protein At3g06035 isoform X2 [Tarenaya hassleriana]